MLWGNSTNVHAKELSAVHASSVFREARRFLSLLQTKRGMDKCVVMVRSKTDEGGAS
jgi:hypothetical protein